MSMKTLFTYAALAANVVSLARAAPSPNGAQTTQNTRRDALLGVSITSCTEPGVVALTFDDGPGTDTTENVLNLLDRYDAKATFFLTGSNFGRIVTEAQPAALVKRMYAEGHQVASHTWSHADLDLAGWWNRQQEMENNANAIREILGVAPTYMRPPYGACNDECQGQLGQLGYRIILWDLDTEDWRYDTPELIGVSKDIFSAGLPADAETGNALVLSHDWKPQTAYSLTEYMLQEVENRGLRTVTVGECLGEPKENWYR